MALTRRQKQVLDFIAGFLEQNGYSPSYEEIARGLDLASLATVHKHIAALDNKHYLKRGINQSRSLDLSPKYFQEVRKHRQGAGGLDIPLLGRIAAGTPVEAMAGAERLDFGDFLNRENVFALEVRGNSMIEDHIMDGDYVIVENRDLPREGEMVIALIRNSEATLKRWRRSGNKIILEPSNPNYTPMSFDSNEVVIQGVVVGILGR